MSREQKELFDEDEKEDALRKQMGLPDPVIRQILPPAETDEVHEGQLELFPKKQAA